MVVSLGGARGVHRRPSVQQYDEPATRRAAPRYTAPRDCVSGLIGRSEGEGEERDCASGFGRVFFCFIPFLPLLPWLYGRRLDRTRG